MSEFKSKIVTRNRTVSISVFVLLMVITQFLAYQNYLLLQSEHKQILLTEINTYHSKIETLLQSARAAATTLAYIVQTKQNQIDSFDEIGRLLVTPNSFLDAIQLVNAQGAITQVYPMTGNEDVIGYNILQDPKRNKEALRAREERTLFFAGPFSLKQGGMGIVGRLPYYDGNQFLGFAAVIIRIETLIRAIGTQKNSSTPILYQLSKKNPDTGIEEFFLPHKDSFSFERSEKAYIKEGDWNIYVQLDNDVSLWSLLPYPILGLFLSLVGSTFIVFLLNEPKRLELQVQQKTSELFTQQQRYQILLENSSDAIMVINQLNKLTYVSPSFSNIFGYSEHELLQKPINEFILEEDLFHVENTINTCKVNSDSQEQLTFRIYTKTKNIRWFEATFSNLLNKHEIGGIVINIHDVTERMSHLEEIQFQNRKLRDIAWTQSHIVRAPLARIMSLVMLLKDSNYSSDEYLILLDYILESARELDTIVCDISKKAERIDWDSGTISF